MIMVNGLRHTRVKIISCLPSSCIIYVGNQNGELNTISFQPCCLVDQLFCSCSSVLTGEVWFRMSRNQCRTEGKEVSIQWKTWTFYHCNPPVFTYPCNLQKRRPVAPSGFLTSGKKIFSTPEIGKLRLETHYRV